VGIPLKRAVFLDRDGVINQSIIRDGKPHPPHRVEDTVIVPGAHDHLTRLKEHGFFLAVVTNQPDVRRGTVDRKNIEDIHRYLRSQLPLDDFFVCYHDDSDGCDCRKPLPGLLLKGSETHHIDLEKSYLVGDRWRDIDAGAAAGCRTILIDYHYKERSSNSLPDVSVACLSEAVDWILKQEMET
jgi:D-glycero-D-manno-heptose 1,7-bisphosphate phosphatase